MRALLLAAATGLLLAISQPPAALGITAWVALVPLLVAIDGQGWQRRVLLGLIAGMLASWSLVGCWLLFAFHEVPLGWVASALLTQATVAVSGVIGLVLFAVLSGGWTSRRFPVMAVPACWVGIEYLRAHVIAGSPWCLLGHSQYAYPPMVQGADVAGVYGVSFIVGVANMSIVAHRLAPPSRLPNASIGIALLLFNLAYGAFRLQQAESDEAPISIHAIHPAWSRSLGEAAEQRLGDLMRISSQIPADPAALLVWPENALRFHLQEDGPLRDTFTSFVQARRQYVIAGLHRYERAHGATRYYNSAVLVAPEGSVVGIADKRILVPVAEAPWRFLPAVDPPFTAGESWTALFAGKRAIGVLMCFESIFPEPARELVRQGATLLVNPTNDEILGGAGAAQLAAMSVFRSIENRVPLVHVASSGVTYIVDARGRIVAAEDKGPRAVVATVSAGERSTWYAQIGDAFAAACCALTVVLLLGRAHRKRDRRRGLVG